MHKLANKKQLIGKGMNVRFVVPNLLKKSQTLGPTMPTLNHHVIHFNNCTVLI